jgi:hypothetical protein
MMPSPLLYTTIMAQSSSHDKTPITLSNEQQWPNINIVAKHRNHGQTPITK